MGSKDKCCCCFDLKNGAFAIGITLLVLSTLAYLIALVMIAVFAAREIPFYVDTSTMWSTKLPILCVTFLAISVTFNSLLVHGARRERRGMVLAWLIYQAIVNGLLTASIIVSMFQFSLSPYFPVWVLILMLIGLGILVVLWYWFAICYMFLRQLENQSGCGYIQQVNEHELMRGGD